MGRLNPESTGGALHFTNVFREASFEKLPAIVETSTLIYGCCAKAHKSKFLIQ
jgi:hypothetical protein